MLGKMEQMFVEASSGSISQVNVHPVVLFSVLDHYIRREVSGDRVIGALLGTVNGNVVEVTNSFGIHHKTTQEEILIRRQTFKDMLELHRRVEPKEQLVGWYSTWKDDRASAGLEDRTGAAGSSEHIDQFTLVVQDFFAEDATLATRPFHMLVDVSLKQPHINVYAYQPLFNNIIKNVIVQFARCRVQIVASIEEKVALDSMVRSARLGEHSTTGTVHPTGEARELVADSDSLESSLRRLKKLLDTVAGYVEDVASGKREGNEAVGRQIADALASVPVMDADRLALAGATGTSIDTAIKDVLMVTYLSNLAAVHLKIAERIAQLPTL